ncbi:GNAT family N-acetyltransferase [Candidatus Uhrbacteria bacterium]|nr:GNAT family N-acetyltransferase [Candidatus Uhrbacteria bacterium]
MTNADQPPERPNGERVPPPAETSVAPEPEGPHELWVQERDPFDDFLAQIDERDERKKPDDAERAEMDARLEALGDLFAGATARWHLDGATNISLLVGDYIGVHKDVDISVDGDDLDALEPMLRARGYGFFLSRLKDPNDPKSARVLRRVGADAVRRAGDHVTLAAVDTNGKVREDAPLNFIDVHLMEHLPDGRVRGIGELGSPIPSEWCMGIPTEFHGRTIQRSHPAKVAYYKLHQTRSYDRTDLEKLAKSGGLTPHDVEEVAVVFERDLVNRRSKANEILTSVVKRLHTGASAEEVFEAFRQEPYLTGDAERWQRVEPQLRVLAERIAAEGGDPNRISAIAEEVLGIERAHAEQMQKVEQLRRWVTDAETANRIRGELGVTRSPIGIQRERERSTVGRLGDFDVEYFQSLEGPDGWIAFGQENCRNPRYFTVYDADGERLGIVGVYDTDNDQYISHTVVDPQFRGQGLAARFKERLMEELNLPFLTLTIATSNIASLRAAERTPGAYRTSDAAYEQEFQKVKFRLERQHGGEALSIMERRQLADVWSRVVLGGRVEAPDSDRQTPEEFRVWLHESLMAEIATLAAEWGMVPDAKLVELHPFGGNASGARATRNRVPPAVSGTVRGAYAAFPSVLRTEHEVGLMAGRDARERGVQLRWRCPHRRTPSRGGWHPAVDWKPSGARRARRAARGWNDVVRGFSQPQHARDPSDARRDRRGAGTRAP